MNCMCAHGREKANLSDAPQLPPRIEYLLSSGLEVRMSSTSHLFTNYLSKNVITLFVITCYIMLLMYPEVQKKKYEHFLKSSCAIRTASMTAESTSRMSEFPKTRSWYFLYAFCSRRKCHRSMPQQYQRGAWIAKTFEHCLKILKTSVLARFRSRSFVVRGSHFSFGGLEFFSWFWVVHSSAKNPRRLRDLNVF